MKNISTTFKQLLYFSILIILPNWAFAQIIYMDGDNIIVDEGNWVMEVSGLPGVGCGLQTGTNATTSVFFDESQRIAEVQNTANKPAGEHHVVERKGQISFYNVTVKITWSTPNRTSNNSLGYESITNANQANDVSNGTGATSFPRVGNTETYTFQYKPQNLSGLNSDVLVLNWLHFTGNQGSPGSFLHTVWCYIPIYVTGAAIGQEEVSVLGQLDAPAIPYLILHDPPGDNSSATFSTTDQYCTTVENRRGNNSTTSSDFGFKLGYKGSLGLIATVDVEAYVKATASFEEEINETSINTYERCLTLTQNINTADASSAVAPGTDWYIGSKTKMDYGVYEAWYFEDCKMKFGKRLVMAPSPVPGDTEEYRLSEEDILLEIATEQATINSASATDYEKAKAQNQKEIWEQLIAFNDSNKENSTRLIRPTAAQGGGISYTDVVTSEITQSRTLDVDYVFESSIGLEFMAEFSGSGISGGFEYKTTQTVGRSTTDSELSSQTIGYTLSDNNDGMTTGDLIRVNIYQDEVFGTPIFRLLEDSKTSCPYEGGIQRDKPRLESGIDDPSCPNPPDVINIENAPAGQPSAPGIIAFPLDICNNSDEERTYFIKLINGSTARVFLEGVPINATDDGRPFHNIPPGECFRTPSDNKPILEIQQSPTLATSYRDIQLYLFPECEESIRSEIIINVEFSSNGTPNFCFEDADGDGIGDATDNCPNTFNRNQQDTDGDNIGDVCDNCPTISNTNQLNNDGDPFGNACDKCPNAASNDQLDTDGDGIGDACDNCPESVINPSGDPDADGLVCDNCPSVANAGLFFDGVDDYLFYRGNDTDIFQNVANSFTYELWVIPAYDIPANEVESNQFNGSFVNPNVSIPFVIYPVNGTQFYGSNHVTLGVAVGPNGVMVVEHGDNYAPSVLVYYSPTPLNDWTHIAVVENDRQVKLYINGEYRTSGWLTPSHLTVKPSFAYGSYTAPDYPAHKFFGRVDEVRIWKGGRTINDIQDDMNREVDPNSNNLKFYMNFNEGLAFGNNTQVSPFPLGGALNPQFSGFRKTGSGSSNYFIGAPINSFDGNDNDIGDYCENPDAVTDSDEDGIRDIDDSCDDSPAVGLVLDGVDDFITVPNNVALVPTTTQAITFEAWIRAENSNEQGMVASIYNNFDSATSNFFIKRNNNGTLTITGNGTDVLISNGTIPENTWAHIAVVFKEHNGSDQTKIYINGILDKVGDLNYNPNNGNQSLRLGRMQGGGVEVYFKGGLDEVRIWQGERSGTAIMNHLSTELAGAESGLLAYYSFDEGTPFFNNTSLTSAIDKTGNNHTGTLQNFTKDGSVSNWVIGAPINEHDTDMDGSGNSCDICQGNDASGDNDFDGLCNEIDPDFYGDSGVCDGSDILIESIEYLFDKTENAFRTIETSGSVIVPNGKEVIYKAPDHILLNAGFEVELGGIFETVMVECTPGGEGRVDNLVIEETTTTTIKDLHIYPNPTTNQTTIAYQLDVPTAVSIELYDINGRKIAQPIDEDMQETGHYQVRVEASQFPTGMYFVLLRTKDGVLSKRLTVMK